MQGPVTVRHHIHFIKVVWIHQQRLVDSCARDARARTKTQTQNTQKQQQKTIVESSQELIVHMRMQTRHTLANALAR